MAESELKNYDDFVMDTSSTKKRAIKVQFKARRTFVRKVTLAICVAFLVIGASLIGIGVNMQGSDSQALVKNQLAVSVIVVGCFVLVIGCIGIMGALMDHKAVVLAYQILLGIMFIVQVVIASVVLADSGKATQLVQSAWLSSDDATRIGIQNDFGCCGIYPNVSAVTPCPAGTSASFSCACGCSDAVVNDLKRKYWPAGFVGIILILLQLAGLVFGFWMLCGKKEAGSNDLMSKTKRKKMQQADTEMTTPADGSSSSSSAPAGAKKDKKTKKKKDKSGDLR